MTSAESGWHNCFVIITAFRRSRLDRLFLFVVAVVDLALTYGIWNVYYILYLILFIVVWVSPFWQVSCCRGFVWFMCRRRSHSFTCFHRARIERCKTTRGYN